MTDLLVKLYDLPDLQPPFSQFLSPEITIRKPLGSEKSFIVKWASKNFEEGWGSEVDVAFSRIPLSCYIAQQGKELIGFACYDSTALGYFGPTGVLEVYRGNGVGKELLLACMYDMKAKGYGYAIIGWAGPIDFYKKFVGAIEIPDSTPGIYRDLLIGDE